MYSGPIFGNKWACPCPYVYSESHLQLALEDAAGLAYVEGGGGVKNQLSGHAAHQHVIIHFTVVPQLNVLFRDTEGDPVCARRSEKEVEEEEDKSKWKEEKKLY